LKENVFIKDKLKKISLADYLKKKLKGAGFIDVDVAKSPLSTKIVIYALKPGFVIGKKGSNIRALTEDLEQKFDYSKVHIEIGEIPDKNLDPKVIVEELAANIAKGIAWKSAVYKALKSIKDAGAIGAEIIAKGNTAGKGQRKRKSRFYFGYMKKAGDQKKLVYLEKKTTFPGLGTIGITVRIVRPGTVFSDKVDVAELARNFKIKMEEELANERKEKLAKSEKEKGSEKKEKKAVEQEVKIEREKTEEEIRFEEEEALESLKEKKIKAKKVSEKKTEKALKKKTAKEKEAGAVEEIPDKAEEM